MTKTILHSPAIEMLHEFGAGKPQPGSGSAAAFEGMGLKVSFALLSHWAFGVAFSGVLIHSLLEMIVEHLKRRIMEKGLKTRYGIFTLIKKILGGALSGGTLWNATPLDS